MNRHDKPGMWECLRYDIRLGAAWECVDRARFAADAILRQQAVSRAVHMTDELVTLLSVRCAGDGCVPECPAGTGADSVGQGLESVQHRLEWCARVIRHYRPGYMAWAPGFACVIGLISLLAVFLGPAVKGCFSNDGFRVTYYRGTNFEYRRMVWWEPQAGRDYSGKAPCWFVPGENYSVQWEGVLHVPRDDTYGFYLQSDDGSRLEIDGAVIVDHWGDHGWAPGKYGEVQLAAGAHPIRIQHYNRTGESALRLRWTGGGIPANTVLGTPYVTKK